MKYILLKDGRKLEVDDTPYIIKEGRLCVYAPCGSNRWNYVYVGKVEKEELK